MTASIALASIADIYSFLLPVVGFEDRADALRYIDAETAGAGFSDQIEPLHLPARSYVPTPGARHDDWETNRVFGMPLTAKQWVKLRDKNKPKAPGAYNLMLLVEGVRSFYRHVERSSRVPPYMYRISEGMRDCYAAWSGFDGRKLAPIRKNATGVDGEAQPGQRIFAARSARGVLYSRVANYSSTGDLSGYTLRVVQMEVNVLDRDATKDDMMRVTVTKQVAHSYRADEKPTASTEYMDAAWKALVERAENGFNSWCREEPEDVEEWRKLFFAQKAKANAERESGSFRNHVKGMDWQAALGEVQEAWQLAVVVDVHCDSKFDDSPHRHDSRGHRVGVMLSRIDDAERRAALSKMVSDFVAPCDKLWSYTGD